MPHDYRLAISCGSSACSVALQSGGEGPVRQLLRVKPRMHNRLLLPMIDRLLAESQIRIGQLNAIVCDIGPGALMGVRLGVAATQSLAYAADIPAFGVSSMQSLARRGQNLARKDGISNCVILPMTDARFGRIYWACYQSSSKQKDPSLAKDSVASVSDAVQPANPVEYRTAALSSLAEITADLLPKTEHPPVVLGDAWKLFSASGNCSIKKRAIFFPESHPLAADLLEWFGNIPKPQPCSPDKLLPIYLRRAV